MRILLWTALLSLGLAASTPVQDAKRALGGVVDTAIQKRIGGVDYLLAVRRPYANSPRVIYLLKPFAGSFTTIWASTDYLGDNPFSDDLLGVDLTDSNGDGKPEVYYAVLNAGNASGLELYNLVDVLNRHTYTVQIGFSQSGAPGEITVPQSLNQPGMSAFRGYLEGKVAQSNRLKDTRNAVSHAKDDWYERYASFFDNATFDPPVRLDVAWKPLTDELCKLDGSVQSKLDVGTTEYRVYFRLGLMAFDLKNHRCGLLVYRNRDDPSLRLEADGDVQLTYDDGSVGPSVQA